MEFFHSQQFIKIKTSLSQFLILTILFLLPFYFIKFRYGWISLNLIEILILLLFLIWFFDKEKKYLILSKRYFAPILLIFAGLFLSMLVNKNYYVGLGVIKGWFFFPILFAIIFFDSLKKNEKILDWSLWAIFGGGALVAIEGLYYWLFDFMTYDGRLRIFFDSPNQLAMYLVVPLIVGLLRFNLKLWNLKLWKRLVVVFSLVLILFNLYLTKSFGAWLSISLALLAIFWLEYRKKWPKKYLSAAIIIFAIFIILAGFPKFENIKKLGDRSSLMSREMIWKSAGLMIQNNPLFGIGPGNFQKKYLEYQKYFPPYLEWAVPQPHNLYFAFWLESGLAGLTGFLWAIWMFFKDNKKAIISNRSYGILCLAIILYFLFHGLVDTTYWRNDMAIIFWVVIGINIYLRRFSADKLSNIY